MNNNSLNRDGAEQMKCPKTTSGNHKWVEYFDGIDEDKTKKENDKLHKKGYVDSFLMVPKYITKCQACGLYKY